MARVPQIDSETKRDRLRLGDLMPALLLLPLICLLAGCASGPKVTRT